MTSRKETTDKVGNRTDDESMHGLRVAFGMTATIAVVVIGYAFAASDEVSQGTIASLPTIEGVDKQIRESYSAIQVVGWDLQQLIAKTLNYLS